MTTLRSFKTVLQEQVLPTDRQWEYTVANLPTPAKTNAAGLVKSVTFISSLSEQRVELRIETAPSNRVTRSESLHKLLILNLANFRLREDEPSADGRLILATARDSAEYTARLLKTGIVLNGIRYHFFGHSNSQLKSRSCFMFAGSKEDISVKIEKFGDFSKMKTVAKKAKRIGLLFSSADMAVKLDPERCDDIDDITLNDYVFTDGCGLISDGLARLVVQRKNIVFRNRRYLPSVFQIRYRGYKGVLTRDPRMKGNTQVRFRKSMKKFTAYEDFSLSIVEYSKPYAFGYLNDEIVLLLHALGVSTETLLRKQDEHFKLHELAFNGRLEQAFQFLSYQSESDLAEKLLMEGIESVVPSIQSLVRQERGRMLNKYEEQRCRIMIPQSRLLFGICDPTGSNDVKGILKPGTCFVRITDGEPRTLINTEVLVTRNPCLHPGDLQKLRVVDVPEFSHLIDCIVFSTWGKRPSADQMSGGDLDGDKFFVTWDPDITPHTIAYAAAYPGVNERIQFEAITDDLRAEFFAKYTNASLGRVKNLYLKWARLTGPLSPECQQLNRLFSQCVDGNRIKVPQNLEDPPNLDLTADPFVLDVLHEAAAATISRAFHNDVNMPDYPEDTMGLLLSSENLALSEFQLTKATLQRCERRREDFNRYADFFNYSALSDEEKAWLLSRLPPTNASPGMVLNGLLQSELVRPAELERFGLDHHGLHWKPVFRSEDDRMGRFLSSVSRATELFHKKLILLQADERLTLMVYIPNMLNKASEAQVDTSIRVFALPRSAGIDSVHYRVVPTLANYRLYFDDSTFQLYQGKRGNTFIFLTRGPTDPNVIPREAGRGYRRKHKQQAIDDGKIFDVRGSVALDKISKPIQTHVGRMNRAGIRSAEIYVISNRDVESMRVLDQWLHYVDTQEVLPLFASTAKPYRIPTLQEVDWTVFSRVVAKIAQSDDISGLSCISTPTEYNDVLYLLSHNNQALKLRTVFEGMLRMGATNGSTIGRMSVLRVSIEFLPEAPFLVECLLRSDLYLESRDELQSEVSATFVQILQRLIAGVNRLGAYVKQPFRAVLQELSKLSLQTTAELAELIALSVEDPEFALDLFLECIIPESSRLLDGTPQEIKRFLESLMGITLDHVDEANDNRTYAKSTLSLQPDGESDGFQAVKAILRIDLPEAPPRVGDHIRFVATTAPDNAPLMRTAMDAIVISSDQNSARFRCLHKPPSFLADCGWKYRYCGSFVTSKAMFDAVATFYGLRSASCGIYQSLLGLPSLADLSITAERQMYHRDTLNASQNRALDTAMSSAVTLLWGPPGTGKTYTIVAILKNLIKSYPESRFLITAPTHNAVDNILRRFASEKGPEESALEPLRVSTNVKRVSLDLIQYTCDAMVGKDLSAGFAGRRDAQKRVQNSRLLFTTCAGAGLGLLRNEEFDVVLVDEASQQTEPETLIPLTKGCQRAILVGDHVQLRATVRKHAVISGFDISLFERTYDAHDVPGVAKVMLDTQYRMHPDLCTFSSNTFYKGNLYSAEAMSAITIPPSRFPWPVAARKVFIECASGESIGGRSKSNEGQVQLCKLVCDLLITTTVDAKAGQTTTNNPPEVAILTPYTAQREALKAAMPNQTISSIDGFQGREADIVIFVTVRSNAHYDIGFLSDMRRLNVAMTRARAGVIVIGNKATLTGHPIDEVETEDRRIWKSLVNQCSQMELPLPS